ncbi:MAG TPA: sulfatase [Bryobacteraceae bacterium]|nr:sulfatase [Bryobacteraceae bacterium]HPT27028.1 sulfatase [Bryobacteraceae bacterium]
MQRRTLLAAAGVAPAFIRTLMAAERPNIVWILAEDLGPQLGCYGYPLVETPNIDHLAAEGVRYEHAHTTAPVCSASRSAFNVGLYQTATGTQNHRSHRTDGYRLPGGAKLVSHRLQEAGYFTANVKGEFAPGTRGMAKTDFNFTAEQPFMGGHWNQRAKGQPFYAQVNFQATHKGPAFVEARKLPKLIDPKSVELPPYWPDHSTVRDEFANYLDCINLLDRNVGALIDVLKRDGLYDNTLVFFMGDNGRCLIRGKQWLYDAGTHVPMIARWPGRAKPGTAVSDPVLSLDMTATTLAAAGVTLPAPFHGRPLWGKGAKPRQHVITARDRCDMTVDRIRCVRDTRCAFIRNFMPERPYTQFNRYIQTQYPTLGAMQELHAAGRLKGAELLFMAGRKPDFEFYDLKQDPHEIRNLAADPAHRQRIREYSAILDEWIQSTADQGRTPEPSEAYADQV